MDGSWMLTSDSVLDDAEAYYNRANAYASKGDIERAIADFRKVLELSDDLGVVGGAKKRLEELGAR